MNMRFMSHVNMHHASVIPSLSALRSMRIPTLQTSSSSSSSTVSYLAHLSNELKQYAKKYESTTTKGVIPPYKTTTMTTTTDEEDEDPSDLINRKHSNARADTQPDAAACYSEGELDA
jgi:hypothetical protein